MYQCLERSGFYGDEVKWRSGFKYNTEHLKFRICNFMILMHTGFKPFVGTGKSGFHIIDLFDETPEVTQELPYQTKQKMYEFLAYIKENGINLLKDPQAGFCIKEWIKLSRTFGEAKYVWMRRSSLPAAKSFVRLKVPRIPQYRGTLTTRKAERIYKQHEAKWAEAMKEVDHIEVWLEKFLAKTEEEADRISSFIGKELDTSLVTKKETFEGGQKFFVDQKNLKRTDLKSVALVWDAKRGVLDERTMVRS